MTKTAARHRAPLSARAWVARTWLAVSTLPAGALAGCTTVGVAASIDRPVVGLLGLGALVVPLSVATWRSRLTDVDPAHGRRAAGRPLSTAAEPAVALERLPIVLDVPDLASLQAATGSVGASDATAVQDAPSRVFTVAAGGAEVEVVVLTREERAASDLALLEQLDAAPAAPAADAAEQRERVAA
jgi:hypothetical protein